MDIKVLGSGSSGNCYKLTDGKTSVLLDAGLPIKKIKQKLNFKLSSIDAVFVTHEHMDHAKAVADLIKLGIPIYATKGTFNALGVENPRHILQHTKYVQVGTLKVFAYNVVHDSKEPVCFVIKSNVTDERLLYMTDTQFSEYVFKGLTHIMIEANYSKENMLKNIANGTLHAQLAKRIVRNHMSLEAVADFIQANKGPRLEEIHLLHLSNANSDEERFKKEVQELTGLPVYVH